MSFKKNNSLSTQQQEGFGVKNKILSEKFSLIPNAVIDLSSTGSTHISMKKNDKTWLNTNASTTSFVHETPQKRKEEELPERGRTIAYEGSSQDRMLSCDPTNTFYSRLMSNLSLDDKQIIPEHKVYQEKIV